MCAPLLTQPVGYERRQPEKTVLYETIQENLETFLAEMDEAGVHLPRTVQKEFESYLRCGILGHGFLRGECRACKSAILVAFSCKRRTACPSCGARRMAAEAAHLVDRVLPHVPVRHWVLSVPFDIRYLLATDRSLLSAVLRIFVDVLSQRYRLRSSAGATGQAGIVAGIHRADSSLRLNPHFHLLVLDGAYRVGGHDDLPTFKAARSPSDEELKAVATRVAKRVRRLFIKRGIVDEDGCPIAEVEVEASLPDERVQFGWLTEDGDAIIAEPDRLGGGTSSAEVAGFSVFAGSAVEDRERLEKLCRYVARPPLANEQVERTNDGRVGIELKRPRRNGETHAFMTPMQLIRRLASLIPPAGMNLLRYFGILASAAQHRSKIVPVPEIDLGISSNGTEPVVPSRRDGLDWASLLRRVWDIDALACPCGGRIRLIAAIEEPAIIRRILNHLNLPAESPLIAPARGPPEPEGWFVSP